jgi:hypothetical protein
MAETTHDDKRRQRIHITVAVLALLVVVMFVSAAWTGLA